MPLTAWQPLQTGAKHYRQHHRHGRTLDAPPALSRDCHTVAVVPCLEDAVLWLPGSHYESEAEVALDVLSVLCLAPGVRRIAVDDQWDQLDARMRSERDIYGVREVGGVLMQGRRLYPDVICEMDDDFANATGIRILVLECKSAVYPHETKPIAQACDYARSTTHKGRPVDAVILLPVRLSWHTESTRQTERLAHHSGVWYGQLDRHKGSGMYTFREGAVSIGSDHKPPSRVYQPDGPAISCNTSLHGGNYTTRILFTQTETIAVPRFCRRKRGSR